MRRTVSCQLLATVSAPTELVVGVAVATGASTTETLSVTVDGADVPPTEVAADHGTRLHLAPAVGPGAVSVIYDAIVDGRAPRAELTEIDRLRYLRPSRYCESDRLAAIAGVRVPRPRRERRRYQVSSWVGMRIAYVAGSSRLTDGEVATLLDREGVCRDFAHLVIAMLGRATCRRASCRSTRRDSIRWTSMPWPRRASKASGSSSTPRSSHREHAPPHRHRPRAADTAFLTADGDRLTLDGMTVSATVDGTLPTDYLTQTVHLT